MKITAIATLLSSGIAGNALAADLPPAPAPFEPVHVWSGGYLGAVVGGGLFTNESSDIWCVTACDAPDMSSWGWALGVTAGWNHQMGAAVFGIEADISWTDFDNSLTITGETYSITHHASWDWLATIRARMGLASNNVLAYVTGGIAIAETDYVSAYAPGGEYYPGESFRDGGTQVGFAAGAGVEIAVNERVSVKAEYLYVGMPDTRTLFSDGECTGFGETPDCYMTNLSGAHLARVGLNYKFGDTAASAAHNGAAHRDWSGGYVGLLASVGLFGNEMSDQWCITACDAPDMSDWGWGLGLTAGWNHQMGMAVIGIETDFSWTDFENSQIVDGGDYSVAHHASWDWLATIRARMGLASGNVLAYVTGGIAIADPSYSSRWAPDSENERAGEGFVDSGTQVGLAAGVGIEVALSRNITVKGEYLYVGMPDTTTGIDIVFCTSTSECLMTNRSQAHLARIGLNYQLGGAAGAAPGGTPHDWSGGYLGLVAAAGLFTDEMSDQWCLTACDAPDMASWGWGLGVSGGWNFQAGMAVYGIEADISWTDFENSLTVVGFDPDYSMTHHASWDWLATVRARVGLASGNVLAYVTGGFAIADVKYSSTYSAGDFDLGGGRYHVDKTQVGFAAGAGVEMAISPNLSVKGEYLYVGMPDKTTDFSLDACFPNECVMTYRSDAHLARVSVNYLFTTR